MAATRRRLQGRLRGTTTRTGGSGPEELEPQGVRLLGARLVFPATYDRRQVSRRLLPLLLLLGACADGPDLGVPEPVTEQGRDILELWHGSVIAGAVVGAIVWGLIVWSVIRYRRRSDDLPSQTPHNIPLEVAYTVGPLMVVAGLVAFTIPVQNRVVDVDREPDLEIDVVGYQWSWEFRYEDDAVVVTSAGSDVDDRPELVLPVGAVVRFNLETRDVVHSFWVPTFLEKRDLIQGVDNRLDVTVEQEGTWRGRCAEFCGLDHWKMLFEVRAVPEDEFTEWFEEMRAA